MMPREVRLLPQGEDWIYEFLWGGVRIRACKQDRGVHLISRDGKEVTNRFPRIAAAVAKLRATSAVIDGEIVYLESYVAPAMRILTAAADELARGTAALVAYDLLYDDGNDLRRFSLLCRKLLLASALQATSIALSPLIAAPAEVALVTASQLGLPGVVAKRAGSAYRPNSLACDWVKVTCGLHAAATTRAIGEAGQGLAARPMRGGRAALPTTLHPAGRA